MSESPLQIDHLTLRLPAGYRARGPAIARRIADQIAATLTEDPLSHAARLERVSIPALMVRTRVSDPVLACQIAAAIVGQLRAHERGDSRTSETTTERQGSRKCST